MLNIYQEPTRWLWLWARNFRVTLVCLNWWPTLEICVAAIKLKRGGIKPPVGEITTSKKEEPKCGCGCGCGDQIWKLFADNLEHFVRFWDKFAFIAIRFVACLFVLCCQRNGFTFQRAQNYATLCVCVRFVSMCVSCLVACQPQEPQNTTQSFVAARKKGLLENVFLLGG